LLHAGDKEAERHNASDGKETNEVLPIKQVQLERLPSPPSKKPVKCCQWNNSNSSAFPVLSPLLCSSTGLWRAGIMDILAANKRHSSSTSLIGCRLVCLVALLHVNLQLIHLCNCGFDTFRQAITFKLCSSMFQVHLLFLQ